MGSSDLDPYDISSRGPPPPPHRTVRPTRSSTAAAAGDTGLYSFRIAVAFFFQSPVELFDCGS